MDFDPSQFLSVDMNVGEGNQERTSNIGPEKDAPEVHTETEKIVVTGGLQLEPVELPVPRFDTLFGSVAEMIENNYGPMDSSKKDPIEVTLPDGIDDEEGHSPLARANSPADRIGKAIQVTYGEQRFRKDVFSGAYERVKLFRLHCTSCDRHLGIAPSHTKHKMRAHKLLQLAVCRNCFDYYGNRSFPLEEGSEIYCCWCGEGGQLFCCSACPKTVCQRCVSQNFGKEKVKEIQENDNWICFVCKPEEIYPHRSIYWAWQHQTKKMRQNLISSPKEIREVLLSKDTSHCCSDDPIDATTVSLPEKNLMIKFPECLIASVHLPRVKAQPDRSPVLPLCKTMFEHLVSTPGSAVNMPVNRVVPQRISTAPLSIANSSFEPQLTPITRNSLPPSMQPKLPMLPSMQQKLPMPPLMQPKLPMPPLMQPKLPMPPSMQRKLLPMPPSMLQTPPPLHLLGMPSTSRNYSAYNQYQSKPYPQPIPLRPLQPNSSRTSPLLMTAQSPYQNQSFPQNYASQSNSYDMRHPQTVDLVGDDSPTGPDISWLEQGVSGIKECLNPIRLQLNQFPQCREDFKHDFGHMANFVERLSYNVKIAICKLAKINTQLLDSKKQALDHQVASVVNEIGGGEMAKSKSANVLKNNSAPTTPPPSEPTLVTSAAPVTPRPANITPSKEDEPILNPALLCETVFSPEAKKDDDGKGLKRKSSRRSTTAGTPPGKKAVQNIRTKLFAKLKKTPTASPPVINLSDDEEPQQGFNAAAQCKKFKIDPCFVKLIKCDG